MNLIRRALIHPMLNEVHDEINRIYCRDQPSSFFDCRALFQQLLATKLPEKVIEHELDLLKKNENHESDFWISQGGFVLISSPEFSLVVEKARLKPAYSINELAVDSLVSPLKFCIGVQQYHLPNNRKQEIFDRNLKVVKGNYVNLIPENILEIDCMRETYDFQIGNDRTYLVKLISSARKTFTWSFQKNDLLAWKHAVVDDVHDALLTAIQALGNFGDAAAVGTLEKFLEHPVHHIRWGAVKALAKLNQECAIKYVEKMTSDTHPEIRAAATKTIVAFGR